jgi:hypothetical protein
MVNGLAPDTKFAAIHLAGCSPDRHLPSDTTLRFGLSVHRAPRICLSSFDEARIGTDRSSDFRNANLVLMACQRSRAANYRDALWRDLDALVHYLFYALLMHGVPKVGQCMTANGGKPGTGPDFVGQFATSPQSYRSPHLPPARITRQTLLSAERIVEGFRYLYAPGRKGEYLSVKRGLNALIRGWRSYDILERLHQFVRSLDGLMRLPKGRATKQFAARIPTFGHGATLAKAAPQIYLLRNFDEHLTDWPNELAHISATTDRDRLIALLEAYAEGLAGFAYRTVLADVSLLRHFKDHATIDTFWQQHRSLWPSRLDLGEIDRRFAYQPRP